VVGEDYPSLEREHVNRGRAYLGFAHCKVCKLSVCRQINRVYNMNGRYEPVSRNPASSDNWNIHRHYHNM
jgi:hypothetical protein